MKILAEKHSENTHVHYFVDEIFLHKKHSENAHVHYFLDENFAEKHSEKNAGGLERRTFSHGPNHWPRW
jgi:hypothetical protein